MIGKLSGRIDYRAADHVLLDVQGVGYIVYCSDRTLSVLPGTGEAVALYTDLLVREDNLQLFGFVTLVEKEWYKLLISVQGVGAKAALAVLGALGPEAVGRSIALGDWATIKTAKGVGPKIAQRIVQELRDKAPQVMALGDAPAAKAASDAAGAPSASQAPEAPAPHVTAASATVQAEALSALSNLGYGPADAARAVAQAASEAEATDTAALIRAALKRLAPD